VAIHEVFQGRNVEAVHPTTPSDLIGDVLRQSRDHPSGSVWGEHIKRLKQEPELAAGLLRKVRSDATNYVQLSTPDQRNLSLFLALAARIEWLEAM
jgi:hypothetical protein